MVQSQEFHRPPLRQVLEAYISVTAATYTARAGDRLIGVNRAGTVTVTLPTAQLRAGRSYTLKDESGAAATNNITVATEGSETIDGSATDTIGDNYGSKTYYSDGSNWFTVPLLGVVAHSLASHSSEAHSELSGVGTDDHHAQAHSLASHSSEAHSELTGIGADDHKPETVVQAVVFDFGTDVATGDGKFYLHIDDKLNGMDLVRVHAEVITAGTTNTTDIQIANVTDVVDMLSTKLTIDSGETGSDTAAAAAVIDTTKDDVVTNDLLRIDVDAVSTTAPKGLIVTLVFQTP